MAFDLHDDGLYGNVGGVRIEGGSRTAPTGLWTAKGLTIASFSSLTRIIPLIKRESTVLVWDALAIRQPG